jgi:hypothetical protein
MIFDIFRVIFLAGIFMFLFVKKPNLPLGGGRYVMYKDRPVTWILIIVFLLIAIIYLNLR